MSNENSSRNKEISVSHNDQLRHLFKSLKALAFGMLLAGIILLVAVHFMNLTPVVEFTILLFFGVCAALYLVGRGKSFLLQYHAVVAKIEAQKNTGSSKSAEMSSKALPVDSNVDESAIDNRAIKPEIKRCDEK